MSNYTNRFAVAKSVNYGASKTSASAEAVGGAYPSDPNNLAEGAIGFYVESTVSGVTGQRLLIKVGGTAGAGKLDADNANITKDTWVSVYQGTATEAVLICQFQAKDLRKAFRKNYTNPVKGATYIGNNGTSGSLNLPTILINDEAIVEEVERFENTEFIDNRKNHNAVLVASETDYSILNKLCKTINNDAGAPVNRNGNAEIIVQGTVADFTGTATALRFTKGSNIVEFVIESAAGYVASTGSVSAGNTISVPHYNMIAASFTATANAHQIYIGNQLILVADAGTDAQNATAIAAAINATNLASATAATNTVTITLNKRVRNAKILVVDDNGGGTYSVLTLTATTVQDTLNTVYRVLDNVTSGATFTLDRVYTGESLIAIGGTSVLLNTGISTPTAGTYGLKIQDVDFFKNVYRSVNSSSVLSNATVTRRGAVFGTGAGERVAIQENKEKTRKTLIPREEPIMKKGETYVNSTLNYDSIVLCYNPVPMTQTVVVENTREMTVIAPTGEGTNGTLSYVEDFLNQATSKLVTTYTTV